MPASSGADKKPVAIYYSCASTQTDQELVRQLDQYLAVLRRVGKITTWHTGQARVGLHREQESAFYLENAQIILLLISPGYFGEDDCYNQMEQALYRMATAGTRVIPVLLRPTPGWKATPIGDLRALPSGERPITGWRHKEEAYASIAGEIDCVVARLLDQQRPLQASGGVVRVEPPPHRHKTILHRKNLVHAIYEKLIQPDTSAVVLTGLKGIGKSTLAAQVYSYAEERRRAGEGPFTAEALWIRIETSGTMTDLLRVVATALGSSYGPFYHLSFQNQKLDLFNPPLNLTVELFNLLKQGSAPRLIVLDQFEEWLNDQPGEATGKYTEVSKWLDLLNGQAHTCRVLLTAHTYPQGEGMYHRIYLQEFCVGGLRVHEGVALLRQWSVQGDEKDLALAVHHCEGHALALVLLERLRQKHQVSLATLLSNPLYRQLWIKDVKRNLWNYTYDHLLEDKSKRHLLAAFSIYREAVPWQAAYAIMQTRIQVTEEQALTALDTVRDYPFLQVRRASEERYALHPLIADFIKTMKDGDTIDIHKAHAEAAHYYQKSSTQSGKPQQRSEDMHRFIEAVWHLCKAEQYQEAYMLMEREEIFANMHRWGGNAILLTIYELLLSSDVSQKEEKKYAQIYNEFGEVYNGLGQKNAARGCFEKALDLYRNVEAWEGEVKALNNLGTIYRADGEIEQALKYYQEALRIGEKIPEHVEKGITLNNLGRALQSLGQRAQTLNESGRQYRQALSYYKQALDVYNVTGDTAEIARTLNNLGEAYTQLYQLERALDHYQRALHNFREIGERRGEGIVCNNLGVFYRLRWQKQDSFEYYMQALHIFREIGDRWQEGIVLRNLGQLYVFVQRTDVALACFLLAKDIFEALRHPEHGAITVKMQTLLAGGQSFEPVAAEIYLRAAQIVEEALTGDI